MTVEGEASARSIARLTGWLYLVIIVCAGFSEGYVRATLVVPGDAAATASNVLAADGLFRLALASDLVAFLADAAVALLFYVLLVPTSKTVALLAAGFRLVAHPAIGALNLLNHWEALALLRGSAGLEAFEVAELQALALQALELHRYGYLIAGAFFGVHLALLGYLLWRSSRFPPLLAALVGLASVGYLAESFAYFILPTLASAASGLVVVTAGVAEVSLCLYLIVVGVRSVEESPA